jgi:ATP-dependent exoDNAse (exonuclease V) alpha subunit
MENQNKYFKFKLTDEQEQLLDKLLTFIKSDKKIFILKGYAGTGKTSIMHGLVKYFGENKIPFTLMASTGRAAKVMAEKARFPAGTVHGTIYILDIVEMPKQGDSKEEANFRILFKMKMPNLEEKRVFFIDESSMLSNHLQKGGNIAFGSGRLLDDLFDHTGKGKVVFIGDPAQLPPVNSKFSAALSQTYLSTTFDQEVETFELKKVMRYKENTGMFYNTTALRNVIMSKQFPPLSIKAHGFDDISVYHHDNELIKKYYEIIKTKGVDSAIYITLSNKQAAVVNSRVRSHLWGYKNTDYLKPGESLMVARNNYLYGLNNGDLVTVDSVENKIIRKAGLKFMHINLRVAHPDPEKGMMIKRVFIIADLLSLNSRDLSVQQDMELLANYFSRMRKIALEVFEILNSTTDVERRRNSLERKIKDAGIHLNIEDTIEQASSKNELIKSIAYDNMQNDPYLNALRVKYGYAITCHKAQGSEWPEVFVHLEKSMFFQEREYQYRWTYTALSRAEQKVHLINNICLY